MYCKGLLIFFVFLKLLTFKELNKMAQEKYRVNIVWFRNGLRLHDSGPLHKATEEQEVDINIFCVLACLSCIKT